MKFVQLNELKTGDLEGFNQTLDAFLTKSDGNRIPTRAVQGQDRDNAGAYIYIVELPSYEAAMENSGRPETVEFAAQLAKICDGPPKVRNM
jgi:hypothetical protein